MITGTDLDIIKAMAYDMCHPSTTDKERQYLLETMIIYINGLKEEENEL